MFLYGHRVNQLARLFMKRFNEDLVNTGLFSSQWGFILYLYEKGSSTQKELSEYLSIEPPTVTRTLARMEEAGWVIKEEGSDRRERKVRLSPRAYEQFSHWDQISDQLEIKALTSIDKADLEVFTRVLQHMKDNLQE
ncbi:MarR family winged helix-turn-helix transcriptional regulator [Pelosinus sp. UFO1]|uniref:MarR family winged helix-turn-helix transcriptional regulator n=1 Tax=Pelosinus sp. UFO1 TaxID=484770 RepID=UPI0004D1405F|nr:MarR family transcriptional regulator [Pelosinus sp. UFO1]AIF52830.1 transcriptional regulator, MarR family [Pelosinus sp. UFO1]